MKTKPLTAKNKKAVDPETRREEAAGGIVLGAEGVLMIKVRNLEGRVVWTFPKGRLEAGETPDQAALREVLEETGWTCRLLEKLGEVRYKFVRDQRPTRKTVHWFHMVPEKKTGESDPEEVLDSRWYSLPQAAALVDYPSDRKIMALLLKKAGIKE